MDITTLAAPDLPAQIHHIRFIPERNQNGEIFGALIIGHDITQQKRMEFELVSRERAFHSLAENLPDNIGRWDCEGRHLYINPVYERTLGKSAAEVIGTLIPDAHGAVKAAILQVAVTGEIITVAQTVTTKEGNTEYHEVNLAPERDLSGKIISVLGIGRDVTERKHIEMVLEKSEQSLKEAQRIAHVGNWDVDMVNDMLTWSDETYRIWEIDKEYFPATFEAFIETVHPEDRELVIKMYNDSLLNRSVYDVEHRLLFPDGRIKYIHERGEPHYDATGKPIRFIGVSLDITERKASEEKIKHMAHHDGLTQLPNRVLAKERAQQIIAQTKRVGAKAAFLFIDLDGFKDINDSLGHSARDLLLITIASRLQLCTQENDTISRQGGDEFLIILSEIYDETAITVTAEKILKELAKPVEITTHTLSVSGSIGIAIYPDHGDIFEVLLKNADTAMYRAKELGKNTHCLYTQQMNYNQIGVFQLQNDLKSATKNNEFVLFYQPQIDLAKNKITGAEALIRWQHPQRGMIPPMSFIPIAESSGMIVQIGQWVIEEACRQAALWHEQGIKICVAVNISAMQFKRGNLEDVVKNALISSQLDPKWLELELTESVMMHDAEKTLQSIRNLKALGVQLSIDDFGTGYSSLAYLKRFAVDKLKIDQSFIRDILNNPEDAIIVQTIIQMSKNLNLLTIAEGVENQEILEVVKNFGCDEVQGYHFAKPMEASALEEFFISYT